MEIGRITGATRRFGAPTNWDATQNGPCGTLVIRDEIVQGCAYMTSAWLPSQEEIAKLAAGAPLLLSINGTVHPVVMLGVGEPPSAPAGIDHVEAGRLSRQVSLMFGEWSSDPALFAETYPFLKISVLREAPADRHAEALRSMADFVMQGRGYTWDVIEAIGVPPMFVITGHDGRPPGPLGR